MCYQVLVSWRRFETMETIIGKVTHYYPKIGVAAVILEDHLATGERIHIHGAHEDFHQTVTSMEYDHTSIPEASKGLDVGIKVIRKVHEGDIVFRET
jgi:putative protease